MSTTEAIIDDVVGRAYMENFAGNIFARADDEERAKKATRATAVKFFAASQFMEVLQCFGDLDSEVHIAFGFSDRRLRRRSSTQSSNAEE